MAVSNSRRNAICAIIGITIGVLFWSTAAILGLSAIFIAYPPIQSLVMTLGGCYLSYLGICMLRVRENVKFSEQHEQVLNQSTTVAKEIRKGLWVNLSNAKVIIFFASIMPLVLINLDNLGQILIALLIILSETFFYFYFVSVLFSRRVAKNFYSNYSRYIDNAAGAVFLLFGCYLIYGGMEIIVGAIYG